MLAPEVEALWESHWRPILRTAKGWELAVDMDKVKQLLYDYKLREIEFELTTKEAYDKGFAAGSKRRFFPPY